MDVWIVSLNRTPRLDDAQSTYLFNSFLTAALALDLTLIFGEASIPDHLVNS